MHDPAHGARAGARAGGGGGAHGDAAAQHGLLLHNLAQLKALAALAEDEEAAVVEHLVPHDLEHAAVRGEAVGARKAHAKALAAAVRRLLLHQVRRHAARTCARCQNYAGVRCRFGGGGGGGTGRAPFLAIEERMEEDAVARLKDLERYVRRGERHNACARALGCCWGANTTREWTPARERVWWKIRASGAVRCGGGAQAAVGKGKHAEGPHLVGRWAAHAHPLALVLASRDTARAHARHLSGVSRQCGALSRAVGSVAGSVMAVHKRPGDEVHMRAVFARMCTRASARA